MSPGPPVRAARREELEALAPALAALPLLVRYGTGAAALSRSLAAAHDRGEGLLLVEAPGAVGLEPAGLAWFQPAGTLAMGGYLRLIALLPGQARRGLGGALLDEVERRTASVSRHLFLLCDADNAGARRFYARRGYVESGTLPGLVRAGIDELLLHKRLP